MAFDPHVEIQEIGNTYVMRDERYVVSLVVGYPHDAHVDSPHAAVAMALDLTRDMGSYDTHWYCYDRRTGELHLIEQEEVEPESDHYYKHTDEDAND